MVRCTQGDEAAWNSLINIDQIGESVGQDLLNFFNQQRNIDIVTDLASELTIEVYEIQKTAQSKITGKTVVFTGTLSAMGRAEAKALAEKLGARVSSSISQKTDYLVVGDAAGSKAKKAEQLGCPYFQSKNGWQCLNEETPINVYRLISPNQTSCRKININPKIETRKAAVLSHAIPIT